MRPMKRSPSSRGKDVVAVLPLGRRHEDLDAVAEAEQPLQARAVPDHRIEGIERPDAGRRLRQVMEPFQDPGGREGGARRGAVGRFHQDRGHGPAALRRTPGAGLRGRERAPEGGQLARCRHADR